MTHIHRYFFKLFALLSLVLSTSAALAEEDFLSIYGDQDLISIATGAETPVARAPSVATVITDEDIAKTGYSDLDEVLQIVPGLHVSRSHIGYAPLYSIRGITTERNQHVLLLINGTPMTSVHFGNRNNTWGGMPVRNIERIEVIRGPGSAVYGADAFAGVINVVTKEYDDVVDQLGARVSSFDTYEAWTLMRGSIGDFKAAFSLEALRTDGHKETIREDAQTIFDTVVGIAPPPGFAPASLAPGHINTDKQMLDAHLDLNWNHWDLHMGYQGRYNMGTGGGLNGALDPDGETNGYRAFADLVYNYSDADSFWDVTAKLSYLDLEDSGDTKLLPPGAFLPLPPGVVPPLVVNGPFPAGLLAKPEVFERHYRFSLSSFYTGFSNHRLRIGAGVSIDDLHKVREKKNFDATFTPLAAGFIDVQNNPALVFIEPGSRRVYHVTLQDEWAFAQNWDLTAGVRADWYSDFGRTVNPRVALVWQTTDKLIVKGLFGRAFRAPSFSEQRIQNNPVIQGASDLSPEIITTVELAGNYRFSDTLEANLNIFRYKMKDLLRFVFDPGVGKLVAKNNDEQIGFGAETEISWQPLTTVKVYANYAFQASRDEATKKDSGMSPHHLIYTRLDWNIWQKLFLHFQGNFVIDRIREPGLPAIGGAPAVPSDPREKIHDYAIFDLHFRYGDENDRFWVGAGVKNIFDKIGREPTFSNALIRKDLPLPGRAVFLEAALRLE